MSWNSIKDKSVPISKRNLTALTQAANQVAAMPAQTPYMLLVGKQNLIMAAFAILQLAALAFTYGDLLDDLRDIAEDIELAQVQKKYVRKLLREFCEKLDD